MYYPKMNLVDHSDHLVSFDHGNAPCVTVNLNHELLAIAILPTFAEFAHSKLEWFVWWHLIMWRPPIVTFIKVEA